VFFGVNWLISELVNWKEKGKSKCKIPQAQDWVKRKSIPYVCTPGQRPGLNTLDAGRRVGIGGEVDFGFVI